MTSRVATKKSIEHVPAVIKEMMLQGSVDEEHARQFIGIVLFGAFTGQRVSRHNRSVESGTVAESTATR
jgi:hypothetical protein